MKTLGCVLAFAVGGCVICGNVKASDSAPAGATSRGEGAGQAAAVKPSPFDVQITALLADANRRGH